MKVTKQTKVVSKRYLLKKVYSDLEKDSDVVDTHNDDENYDDGYYEDLSDVVDNLLAVKEVKDKKWVAIDNIDFMPISDYEKHYHETDVGATEDAPVTEIEI